MKIWLFDIDGTLIVSRGAGQEATWAALEVAFQVAPRAGEVLFAGRTDRAIAADLFRLHDIPLTVENWFAFRDAYLRELEQRLPGREGQILPGVHQILARLAANPAAHLGLLTGNIRDGAAAKLRFFGLWEHFAFGGFGDEHESRDRVAADARRAAESHLRRPLQGQDIWVVGDTVHDVRCARAIGARCLAVATGGTSADELAAAEPDMLLDDLQLTDRIIQEVDAP